MKLVFVLALTAFALLGAGCGENGNEGAGGTTGRNGTLTVELKEQNDSGQSGEASLTELDDSTTRVDLTLSNPPSEMQPAHIHEGSCKSLDPRPAYPLQSLADGTSTSEVEASLEELRGGDFVINVHRSVAESEIYVACGAIGSGSGGTETGEDEPRTTTDYGY